MTVYSVGLFKNKDSDMIFTLPFGFDRDGIRTGLNKVQVLQPPYESNAIGSALKESMDTIIKKKYTEANMVDAIEQITGIKSNSKFTKLHLHFSAKFHPNDGYNLKPQKRYPDSSYRNFEHEVPIIKLAVNATDEELGEAVLETFKHCK